MAQLKTGSTVGGLLIANNPMTHAGDMIYGGVSGIGARMPYGSQGQIIEMGAANTPGWVSKGLVQIKHYASGAYQHITASCAEDDTVMQKTEGDEWSTLAITPQNIANLLLIDVNVMAAMDQEAIMGLFQDDLANALTVTYAAKGYTGQQRGNLYLRYYMVAGTITTITFKVRVARRASAGTWVRINGSGAGARIFGGVANSTITIFEMRG